MNLRSLFGGQLLPDFARGIHPPQNKSLTRDLAIETLPLPTVVTIPLLQHAGVPAECVVKPRQQVELGEVIGRRIAGGLSASIHASVAGTVATDERHADEHTAINGALGRLSRGIAKRVEKRQTLDHQADAAAAEEA